LLGLENPWTRDLLIEPRNGKERWRGAPESFYGGLRVISAQNLYMHSMFKAE
jgi:hypothetical protein